uniref:Uncharacterized protein n=1 Tax=Anguilla anguilla TaxID=7936 RepID=A0A0E9PSK3_ANGAN
MYEIKYKTEIRSMSACSEVKAFTKVKSTYEKKIIWIIFKVEEIYNACFVRRCFGNKHANHK